MQGSKGHRRVSSVDAADSLRLGNNDARKSCVDADGSEGEPKEVGWTVVGILCFNCSSSLVPDVHLQT